MDNPNGQNFVAQPINFFRGWIETAIIGSVFSAIFSFLLFVYGLYYSYETPPESVFFQVINLEIFFLVLASIVIWISMYLSNLVRVVLKNKETSEFTGRSVAIIVSEAFFILFCIMFVNFFPFNLFYSFFSGRGPEAVMIIFGMWTFLCIFFLNFLLLNRKR